LDELEPPEFAARIRRVRELIRGCGLTREKPAERVRGRS
jgi:hypothetical protein